MARRTRSGFPIQVEAMRDIDRALFAGNDPSVVLQHHFWEKGVRWWDVGASSTYYTHFVFPVIALAVLWVVSHRQWVRFMKRFATVLGVGLRDVRRPADGAAVDGVAAATS